MNDKALRKTIEAITLPIVELAGPTPEGYELLNRQTVTLPSKLITTNIAKQVTLNPFGDKPQTFIVDRVADVKALPFDDASLGMIMVSALPLSDHDAHNGPYTAAIEQQVAAEYDAVCSGDLSVIRYALHLHLYKEAGRVLAPGGPLLQVWPHERDIEAAQQFGLALIFERQHTDHAVVFQKLSGS